MNFKEQNKDVLKFILNERFFKVWKREEYQNLWNLTNLELFITSTCNQKCQYCYLDQHGNELYPQEFNNKDLIITNLITILNWSISEHFYIHTLDLFSGEIWQSSFGLEVLDLIYKACLNGLQVAEIMVVSNCSFVMDKYQLGEIQKRINKFNEINTRLCFSISVDGAIVENYSRPLKNGTEKQKDYYDELFCFAKKNNFYFHPMISPQNIKDQIENMKWWISQCQKYDMEYSRVVMCLEVRNNTWTDENIEDFKKLQDFLFNYEFSKFNSPIKYLMYNLNDEDYSTDKCYMQQLLLNQPNVPNCGSSTNLTIRLGDLAIVPCHRTCYDKYIYGYLKFENNKLIDIDVINPYMAIRVLLFNNNNSLGCSSCLYNDFCAKGCFGAQIEENNDPFVPSSNLCHFFDEKYSHLINLYEKYGIIDICKQIDKNYKNYSQIACILNLYEGVKKREMGQT